MKTTALVVVAINLFFFSEHVDEAVSMASHKNSIRFDDGEEGRPGTRITKCKGMGKRHDTGGGVPGRRSRRLATDGVKREERLSGSSRLVIDGRRWKRSS